MNQLHDIFFYGDYRAMRVGGDTSRSDCKYYKDMFRLGGDSDA